MRYARRKKTEAMNDWSDEETDDPLYAFLRYATRLRLTIRQRMRVVDEWPRHETLL